MRAKVMVAAATVCLAAGMATGAMRPTPEYLKHATV
jgi:hypothetical protein